MRERFFGPVGVKIPSPAPVNLPVHAPARLSDGLIFFSNTTIRPAPLKTL